MDAPIDMENKDGETSIFAVSYVENERSFIPHNTRIPSLEFLVPAADSALRKSSILAATFNLIATIVGGGVLSLPFAFQQAGLGGATILMIIAAVITDFSLYILCSCARRTGASSYVGVALKAFGPGFELCATAILFVYLWFVAVAFMVLIADIWSPIILHVFTSPTAEEEDQEDMILWGVIRARNLVLVGCMIMLSPLLLRRDLHALRHTCYIGFASICTLCVALVYRSTQRNCVNPALFSTDITYMPKAFGNGLFAFPIISLAFLSSFNIISVHCSLVDPTRKRVRMVIDRAVVVSFILMFVFGTAGYLYGYESTRGNILLNFSASDKVIFLGRIGCGITMLFAMPLSFLPFRQAFMDLRSQYLNWRESRKDQRSLKSTEGSVVQEEEIKVVNEETPLLLHLTIDDDAGIHQTSEPTMKDSLTHFAVTFFLLASSFSFAVAVPGVEVVWGIVGSSMAFFVAYILPAACYIKLRSGSKGHFTPRVFCAWLLLVFSIFGAIACTTQTIRRLSGTSV